ncbi:MAG: FxsA cytoplasmic rane protein [Hyphomicrobiales bacterium]|nr:FxsA cytoplasmic rane protein [Hyphomicrobiales bacterium]
MSRSQKVLLLLAGWLAAEFAVFALVVSAVGWSAALVLGIMTSLAGFVMIRDIGRRIFATLGTGLRSGNIGSGAMLEGSLQGIGAALLILPGFLSDLIGLALASPSLRSGIVRRFGPRQATRSDTLDLTPDEWRRTETEAPVSKIERVNSVR